MLFILKNTLKTMNSKSLYDIYPCLKKYKCFNFSGVTFNGWSVDRKYYIDLRSEEELLKLKEDLHSLLYVDDQNHYIIIIENSTKKEGR